MALGDFPCKSRANTTEFAQGYERSFGGRVKYFCPYCSVTVQETDSKCWQCKEELTPSKLEKKEF